MRGLIFVLFCLGLTLPVTALAQGWTAQLSSRNYLPSCFAVDKSQQQAFLVKPPQDPAQPLSPWRTLICSTGQKDGDKEKEGDLKTPEGIYFIVGKISSGLDFFEYGHTAFTLNYPNPVDRIRGKTGSGIWIHGRGVPLTPKMTRGCVSLLNADVDHLDDHVFLHTTPILISQNLEWSNATQPRAVAEIAAGTRAWAHAWTQGESTLARFYDTQLFFLSSGRSLEEYFQEIKAIKQKSVWLDLRVDDLHIMEGPGYMVSAFIQRTMPESTTGYRRLYWMQQDNRWVIVGEEWIAQDLDFPDYEEMVEQEIRNTLHQAEQWWFDKKHHQIMRLYAPGARRGILKGKKAIAQGIQMEMSVIDNPFSGSLTLDITAPGIEVVLTRGQGAARTFIFHPGPKNTWRIIAEDLVP